MASAMVDGLLAKQAAKPADLACIVLEPMFGSTGCIPAEPGFLRALRDVTREIGALLIFDEVMTSRLAPGGLHGVHGINPDLVTLGKYAGDYGLVMNGATSANALSIYELQAKEFTGYWSGQESLDTALGNVKAGMAKLLK